MFQQVNLTLMSQWCSGKVVSSYPGLRGFDSQCGCRKFLINIKISCTDSYIDMHVHGRIFHDQITSKVILTKKEKKGILI